MVTTGLASENDGNLNVLVDSGEGYFPVNFPKFYYGGNVVVDQCFDKLISVQVNNQLDDAWTGSIELSTDRKASYFPFECADCTGSTNSMPVVVDGGNDSYDQATTWCFDGRTCTMVYKIENSTLLS